MGSLKTGSCPGPWYLVSMSRFPIINFRLIPFVLVLFFLANATACQTTSIDASRDGRSTWRSQQLDLVPEGGRIHVSVVCDSDDPITVVLLCEDVSEDSENQSGSSCAAASGFTRNGILLVRFHDLPVAEYMVIAFHDANGDGRLIEKFVPADFATDFTEPHSKLERFDVQEGDTINVSLDLEIIHGHGDQES